MYFPWLPKFPLTIIRYHNKLSTELCLKIEHLFSVVILTPIVYITRYIYEEISWDQRLFKFMFLFSWVFIWEKENHTPNDEHKYKQKKWKKKKRNEKHAKKHSEIKWTLFAILVSVITSNYKYTNIALHFSTTGEETIFVFLSKIN